MPQGEASVRVVRFASLEATDNVLVGTLNLPAVKSLNPVGGLRDLHNGQQQMRRERQFT